MTNMERYRRHLCVSSVCPVCKGGEETIIHVLRDCPAMLGIWTRISPTRGSRYFFDQSLLEWIYDNIGKKEGLEENSWATTFAMAIWWGWKWRCGNVFGENGKCRDRVQFIKDVSKEVVCAHLVTRAGSSQGTRVERLIGWSPPSEGWVKLNTDGAVRGDHGMATAGGVLRGGDGCWGGGFAVNIGICSVPLAELWGVYYGLYIAWDRRITHLELEVDSELVVGFLQTGICDSHPLSFLVRLCYDFLAKDWTVRISHVYREANRLADELANYAFSLPLGFHSFYSSPDCVRPIVLEDANGFTSSRRVRL